MMATTHGGSPSALRLDLLQAKPRAPAGVGGGGVFPCFPETVGLCVLVVGLCRDISVSHGAVGHLGAMEISGSLCSLTQATLG